MPKRKKLTAEEWRAVFRLRCRAKQGQDLPKQDLAMCMAAFREDPERYAAITADVFDATVPFGSNARARRP